MNKQIDIMLRTCNENPIEAIGKIKELVESCCKSILDTENENVENDIKMPQLVKRMLKVINVPEETIEMDSREEKTIKQIVGSLNGLASEIVELEVGMVV